MSKKGGYRQTDKGILQLYNIIVDDYIIQVTIFHIIIICMQPQ